MNVKMNVFIGNAVGAVNQNASVSRIYTFAQHLIIYRTTPVFIPICFFGIYINNIVIIAFGKLTAYPHLLFNAGLGAVLITPVSNVASINHSLG